jgi:hypothetical protein
MSIKVFVFGIAIVAAVFVASIHYSNKKFYQPLEMNVQQKKNGDYVVRYRTPKSTHAHNPLATSIPPRQNPLPEKKELK